MERNCYDRAEAAYDDWREALEGTMDTWLCVMPTAPQCKCGRTPGVWHQRGGMEAWVVCDYCQIAVCAKTEEPMNATTMAAARKNAVDQWTQLMLDIRDD